MKVSLDGGVTWQESDGVRVMFEGLLDPRFTDSVELMKEVTVDLQLNVTTEGLICDVLSGLGEVATSSETAQEIVERLCL